MTKISSLKKYPPLESCLAFLLAPAAHVTTDEFPLTTRIGLQKHAVLRIIMLSTHIWIRFPYQVLNDQKLEKTYRWKKFVSKIAIFLSQGPIITGEDFQASKAVLRIRIRDQ